MNIFTPAQVSLLCPMQARLVQSACYLNCQVAPAIPTPASKPALDIFRLLYMPCRLIPGHSIWFGCPRANEVQDQSIKGVELPTKPALPHFKMEELMERYEAKLFIASNAGKTGNVNLRIPKTELEMTKKIAQETKLDVTTVNRIALRLLDEMTATDEERQSPALRISEEQLSGLFGKLMMELPRRSLPQEVLNFRIPQGEAQLFETIMDRLDLNKTKTVRLALRLITEVVK